MALRNLPLPVKVLYTSIMMTLGTGYFFALTYLFIVDIQPHTEDGAGVVQVVMEKYYGRRDMTTLEASLEGGMGDEVTAEEKAQLLEWIHGGATEEEYVNISSIVENSCAVCHNYEDMPESALTTFGEMRGIAKQDTGVSVKTLVRVSHIHIFGLTFIFTIISGIFVQSEAKSSWRAVLVLIPFTAIWADVGGWWFTRFNPAFAYTVIVGGALAGMSLGLQIFLSLFEMWLLPPNPGMVQPQAGYPPAAYPPAAYPPGAYPPMPPGTYVVVAPQPVGMPPPGVPGAPAAPPPPPPPEGPPPETDGEGSAGPGAGI